MLHSPFVIVDTGHDEMPELPQGHEHIGVATVEQVEATDGVNLAVGPAGGKEGLERDGRINHLENLGVERPQGPAVNKEGQLPLDLSELLRGEQKGPRKKVALVYI